MKHKLRHWAHPAAGAAAAFVAQEQPELGLSLFAAFVVYEVIQDWRCKTNSYLDIFEAVVAYFVTSVGFSIAQMIL